MTLPFSGTISFSNLKAEWNDSNPVSLSEFYAGGTNVGANAINVPSSGKIDLSDLYGVSNGWLNNYQSGTDLNIQDMALSPSGFLYLAGSFNSTFYPYASKINATSGEIVWQKYLPVAAYGGSVAIDSSENSYRLYFPSTNFGALLTKYNSAGTLQWQYTIDNVGVSSPVDPGDIAVDSSGNIYVSFSTDTTSGISASVVAKFDSNLSLQWTQTFSNLTASTTAYAERLVLDSSGNVYVSFSSTPAGSSNLLSYLAKYNSSGTLQWCKTVNSFAFFNYGLAIDSSNNIYMGTSLPGSGVSGTLLKVDTNGNLVWQRTTSGLKVVPTTCDSSGNIFVSVGDSTFNPQGGSTILKYNSSGVIQSDSRLYTLSSGQTSIAVDVKVSSTNVPYILFNNYAASSTNAGVIKKSAVNSYLPTTVNIAYPNVGGLYYTYSASALSDSAGSLTWQDYNPFVIYTSGVVSIGLTARSYTDTAASISLVKVNSAY
jgi:hypothetical protein